MESKYKNPDLYWEYIRKISVLRGQIRRVEDRIVKYGASKKDLRTFLRLVKKLRSGLVV